MGSVALGQVQQSRERIEAGGELHADLAHGVVDVFVHGHQSALDGDDPGDQDHDDDRNNNECHKSCLPF